MLVAALAGLVAGWGLARVAALLLPASKRSSLPRAWAAVVVTAALFAAVGATAASTAGIVYGCALAGLAVLTTLTDLAARIVPNRALAVAALLWLPLWWLARPGPFTGSLLGGAIFAAPFLLAAAIRPGAMGFGDVKLAAVLGLYLGWPLAFAGLALGVIAGGAGAVAQVARRRRARGESIPYAPFLAAGAVAALLWGAALLRGWVG